MSYFSITIGNKNTWNDWHLIPKTRPVILPASPRTNYVEVPGANGDLDLTTALSGEVKYQNRTGQWDFYTDVDFMDWQELYSSIMNTIHGKNLRIVMETDPLFYYEGRVTVANWSTGSNWSTISFSYNLAPYKKLISGTMRSWIWDTFDLEFGFIKEYTDISVSGSKTIEVIGATINATPIIRSSVAGMVVTKSDKSVILNQGINVISDFKITPGINTLTFTGNGIVTVDFEGRSL